MFFFNVIFQLSFIHFFNKLWILLFPICKNKCSDVNLYKTWSILQRFRKKSKNFIAFFLNYFVKLWEYSAKFQKKKSVKLYKSYKKITKIDNFFKYFRIWAENSSAQLPYQFCPLACSQNEKKFLRESIKKFIHNPKKNNIICNK